jgi:putative proteasome-type protease
MTYCVGLCLSGGLVLLSDTMTNAGLDNISRFTKMFTFEKPGERVMALMTSGNLSITQGVIARLRYGIRCGEKDSGLETIMNAESMFQVAQKVGAEMVRMQAENREAMLRHGASPDACILLAGQRRGGKHRLFLIYSAGNFIKATPDTPFFQLGENKYGKPILDRIITPASSLEEGVQAVLVSMDSTQKSNLSVGMPLDLAVIEKDALAFRARRRIERDDPGYTAISQAWSKAIRKGFEELPAFPEQGGRG